MKKQTILSVSALVCAAALALLLFTFGRQGGNTGAAETAFLTKARDTTAVQKTAEEVQRERDEERARLIISDMSARAQETIVIDDYGEFIADLKALLEEDAQNQENDLSLLTLVDKTHPLPDGYAPSRLIPLVKNDAFNVIRNDLSLRPEAYEALVIMGRAARNDGVTLLASSTYRSYEYQKKVFERWVAIDGLAEAERESSRAGTSQHQLGLVIDFGSIDNTFANTRAGAWMKEHAEDYGWSLSFPDGYEDITGYRWESWHFRYIGKKACAFQKKYFGDIQQFMLEFIDAWKSL
ncbi:M15 family metallopeptidase [Treponema socranskii]|uniref:M15 family metallopeptidase n=1 Tax=Treponema socranskii TaxID=53419 RepID=UPI0028719C93|nr:M15 family metallopeptidase [Treponema socranskii]MDR9858788.1 M15 family metallopeptidase [Treponema socranskii]